MEEAECYGVRNGRPQTSPGGQLRLGQALYLHCAVQCHRSPVQVTAFQRSTQCSARPSQTGDTASDGATLNPSPGDSRPCVFIVEQNRGLLWATPPPAQVPSEIGGLVCCPQRCIRHWELACSVGNAGGTQRNGLFSGAKQGYTQTLWPNGSTSALSRVKRLGADSGPSQTSTLIFTFREGVLLFCF